MHKRAQIRLTPEEHLTLLQQSKTMALCTIGKDGYPHVVAMAFMMKDGCISMTSYRTAQKEVNVRRNPKVAVMVETGEQCHELKCLMIRGRCELIEEPDEVWRIVREVRTFQGGKADAVDPARAQKRAALKLVPEKIASWDHNKLGLGVD